MIQENYRPVEAKVLERINLNTYQISMLTLFKKAFQKMKTKFGLIIKIKL
jgi:hypothetical protein